MSQPLFNDVSEHDVILLFPQFMADPIRYYAHSSVLSTINYFQEKLQNLFIGDDKKALEGESVEKTESSDMITLDNITGVEKLIEIDMKVYNNFAFAVVMEYLYGVDEDEIILENVDDIIDVLRFSMMLGIPKVMSWALKKLEDDSYDSHFFKLYYLAKTFGIIELENKLKPQFRQSVKLSMYINYFDESILLGFIEDFLGDQYQQTKVLECVLYWTKNNIPDSDVLKLKQLLIPLAGKITVKTKYQVILETFTKFGNDSSKLSDELFVFLYNSLFSMIDFGKI